MNTDLVVAGVLVAVAALMLLSHVLRTPYPILLVIGGCVIGFVPGVPDVELDPELVLLIVLPPLLYSAAFFSSLRDLRANLKAIAVLAIGVVVTTMLVVAWVAHEVIGIPWAAAFVLGAIVSPTDAVAAGAITQRLGVPRRIVTIVEGESLINDGTALVLYATAVTAATTGSFSFGEGALKFVGGAVAGVAIGFAVGWIVARVRKPLDDPPTEITISILTAYFAYLPAEALGVSGVLAAVTTGIYLGWRSPALINPGTRIQLFAIWELLQFLLNAGLFVLIGLQLPHVIDGLSGESAPTLIGYGAAIAAAVIVTRLAWVPFFTYAPGMAKPRPSLRGVTIVAWAGMRGAVSLAAALALPESVPMRDLIVFLTYCVILATLVGQGLTLPPLIKMLRIEDDGGEEREENKARLRAAKAALRRIEELRTEEWLMDETADRMRGMFEYRTRRFAARFDDGDDGGLDERSERYQRAVRLVIDAQREEIVEMRNQGHINDTVMHRIERDLDLEWQRLE